MKEDLVVIEGGELIVDGSSLFSDLYLNLYKSEILGIVFGNVVERKCLLEFFRGEKILSGGKVFICNIKCSYDNTPYYFIKYTTIIEKRSKLIDNLTVEENIFLFSDTNPIVSKRKYKEKLVAFIYKFQINSFIHKPIKSLSQKEKIIIELLKAYYEEKNIIILNHLSGILLRNDLEDIHSLILKLKDYGISFIIIESFNNSVFEWVNSFLLIQNGRTTGIFDSNSYNSRQLYSILYKNTKSFDKTSLYSDGRIDIEHSRPMLTFRNINTNLMKHFNMQIWAGELIHIVCLDDDSLDHMIHLLKGAIVPISGDILLHDRPIDIKNLSNALDNGICFIEESPYENMLFYNMTLKDNLALALSEKVPFFWLKRKYKKSIEHFIRSFQLEEYVDIKLRKLDPRILQEVAYLKWYLYAPNVVICIKPFTELDINLQEITKEMIYFLKSRGITVIILTTTLSTINKMDGNTVYILNGEILNENAVYNILYKG